MNSPIQPVRGMSDILPSEIAHWQQLEAVAREVLAAYGYEEMRVPVVEQTDLFKRSIGEFTDIVEKEMYTFIDKGGESLTLRPEATAGMVRAAISNGITHNQRLRVWSMGPMFRHEKPQKGRYRQFHQIDVEAFGYPGPDVDAELILIAARLWKRLGIGSVRLEVNSLGTPESRKVYREQLVQYLRKHESALDEDSRRRLGGNPLRILDSKNPAMRAADRRCAPDHGSPRCGIARAFRCAVRASGRGGDRVPDQSAAGAGPRLLHAHRVRVGDRCARCAGRRVLRRAL